MILKRIYPIIIMILISSWLLFGIDKYPYPPGSKYSDFTITHYPNAYFMQRSIVQYHQIPLWSSTILSGYPFVANPLSGIWYLPNWLVIWLEPQIGINFLVIAHLIFGALGMFQLLKDSGKGIFASLTGGILFILMPKLIAHYGAGHVTLIYSVCWTPWLLWIEGKAFKTKSIHYYLSTVIVLGMILIADVRWFPLVGLLWLGYRFCYLEKFTIKNFRTVIKTAVVKTIQVLGSLGLASPLLVPMFEYVRLSTRNNLSLSDRLIYSLPPSQILGFIFPDFWGFAEEMTYFGAICLVFLIFILAGKEIRKKNVFWITTFTLSLVLSFGENLPGIGLIYQFPGMNLLRVPSRWLLVSGICLAFLVSCGIDELWNDFPYSFSFNPGLAWLGLLSFVVLLTVGITYVTKKLSPEFFWGSLFCILFTTLIWLRKNKVIKRELFIIIIIPLICLDLGGVCSSLIDFRCSEEIFNFQIPIDKLLTVTSDTFRIYSPSYSLPQHIAARYGVSLADGVDPLQLFDYKVLMEKATGIPNPTYSVTLPPFANGDPSIDNQSYQPDAGLLGLLNVKYVFSQFDLRSNGLVFMGSWENTRVYENEFFLPRAWVQKEDAAIGKDILSIPQTYNTPNWLLIAAKGPGVLVDSDLQYPGWKVYIDQQRANFSDESGLLRTIHINEGEHQVFIAYQPESVIIGFGLCTFTWIFMVFLLLKLPKRA
jgi:hypothetical protein